MAGLFVKPIVGRIPQQAAPRLSCYKNRALALCSSSPSLSSSSSIHHHPTSTFRSIPTSRPFSSSTKMATSKSFIDAVKDRRTIYTLSPESTISDDRIVEIVETAIKSAPSSFNSQSTRAVVLLKAEHEKLWEATKEILKAVVPAENFPSTEQRINGFKNAYGTVLWFEDPAPIKALQEQLPLYAANFPVWSEHTSAIHQYIVWTALEAEGLGANLQHYSPLIDQKIQSEWNVPAEWSLKAQLVFGKPTAGPGEKTFKPVEERLKVYGK